MNYQNDPLLNDMQFDRWRQQQKKSRSGKSAMVNYEFPQCFCARTLRGAAAVAL